MSGPRGDLPLVKKRGKPLRTAALRFLGPGAAVSLSIDFVAWTLSREGNPVRVALGLGILGAAGFAIALGFLIDRHDARTLGIRGPRG